MLRHLTILALLFAGGGAMAEPAVWDAHPHLLCRGEKAAVMCKLDGGPCATTAMTAIWRIDFPEGQVTYLTDGAIEKIIARNRHIYKDVVLGEQILIDSGRVIRFYPAEDFKPMSAVVLGSSAAGSADISLFTCFPQ